MDFFFFMGGYQTSAQPPNLKGQGSPLVWHLPFHLSGMGDLISSYANAVIALRTFN